MKSAHETNIKHISVSTISSMNDQYDFFQFPKPLKHSVKKNVPNVSQYITSNIRIFSVMKILHCYKQFKYLEGTHKYRYTHEKPEFKYFYILNSVD